MKLLTIIILGMFGAGITLGYVWGYTDSEVIEKIKTVTVTEKCDGGLTYATPTCPVINETEIESLRRQEFLALQNQLKQCQDNSITVITQRDIALDLSERVGEKLTECQKQKQNLVETYKCELL